jgi:hypothetical protein
MKSPNITKYSLLLTLILLSASFCDARHSSASRPTTCLTSLLVRGGSTPYSGYDDDPPDHETVQERVNAWRQQQHEAATHLTPQQATSARDERGRLKLLTSVSKGSRALIFFVLMWRDIHLYEVADQTFKGLTRLLTVVPLLFLFIGNLAGAVASVTSPSHSAKKRLKAILNLDKLVEALMILYSFGRLTIFPSKYTPREIYIANTLHSIFFILQSQAFTRLTWDEFSESQTAASQTTASGMNPYSSYYGATEHASRDSYRDEESRREWNEDTKQYY